MTQDPRRRAPAAAGPPMASTSAAPMHAPTAAAPSAPANVKPLPETVGVRGRTSFCVVCASNNVRRRSAVARLTAQNRSMEGHNVLSYVGPRRLALIAQTRQLQRHLRGHRFRGSSSRRVDRSPERLRLWNAVRANVYGPQRARRAIVRWRQFKDRVLGVNGGRASRLRL